MHVMFSLVTHAYDDESALHLKMINVNPTSGTEVLHGFSHMFFNTFDEVRLIPGLLEVEVVEVCLKF